MLRRKLMKMTKGMENGWRGWKINNKEHVKQARSREKGKGNVKKLVGAEDRRKNGMTHSSITGDIKGLKDKPKLSGREMND